MYLSAVLGFGFLQSTGLIQTRRKAVKEALGADPRELAVCSVVPGLRQIPARLPHWLTVPVFSGLHILRLWHAFFLVLMGNKDYIRVPFITF